MLSTATRRKNMAPVLRGKVHRHRSERHIYRLQPQSTFEKWRDETPVGFSFAIKGHRYVTHNQKLIDVEEPVIRCRDAASPLGKRLAAVVWQLSASFKKEH